jgi:hypothetical protein
MPDGDCRSKAVAGKAACRTKAKRLGRTRRIATFKGTSMIASLRQRLTKERRAGRPGRRARLGFYGYRYRRARSRTSIAARCAITTILLIATIAAASEQLSRSQ